MDNDNGVNLNQQTSEEKRVTKWRTLGILAACLTITLLLSTIVYLILISRQPTPRIPTTAPISPQVTTYESVTPTPAADLPPLYSGFKWQYTEKKVKGSSYTRKGGTIELEMYRADSETLTDYPIEFVTYYKQELTTRGWIETAMAGSGISGDFYFYEKSGRYINFGVFVARDSSGEILGKYWAFVEHN